MKGVGTVILNVISQTVRSHMGFIHQSKVSQLFVIAWPSVHDIDVGGLRQCLMSAVRHDPGGRQGFVFIF
jgi:hypothetical protein